MMGLEVLRLIRASRPTLPVVVITGHASSEQIEAAKRLGVTDCLTKPFVLNQLNQALGSLTAERFPRARITPRSSRGKGRGDRPPRPSREPSG